MNDIEIIDLYFSRSESAIEKTDKKYGKLLTALSENILNDRSDAEECVSDTYKKVWDTIPPQRPQCFRAFLSRITRNRALDMLKKKLSAKRCPSEAALAIDELSECVSGVDNVENEMDAIELKKDINAFLQRLDEEKRNIFLCRYWYSYPVKEIAKSFSKKESAVAVILCRTREKLKIYLKERGYEI